MQETWVRSLGQADPLEKEVATHSSILAWKIAGTEEPGGLQSMGLQRVGHDWVTSLSLSLLSEVHHWASLVDQSVITSLRCWRPGFDPWVRTISWRRKCNPLQHSRLETTLDRGAWQACPWGHKSQTQLSDYTTTTT